MIWIFKSDRASAGFCENYEDLFQYIREKENLKPLEGQPMFGHSWSFTLFTPQQVSTIYLNMKQSQPTEIFKEAHLKELGLLEIYRGDPQKCMKVLVTPDVDIEALKKEWCLEYCNAHGYIITENVSSPQHSVQSQWQPQSLPS